MNSKLSISSIVIGGGRLVIGNKTDKIQDKITELKIAKQVIKDEACILKRRVILKTALGSVFGYDNLTDIQEVPMLHHVHMLEKNLNLIEPVLKAGEYIIKQLSGKKIKLNATNFHKRITEVISKNKNKLTKVCLKSSKMAEACSTQHLKQIKFPKLSEDMYNVLETDFATTYGLDQIEELIQKIKLLSTYMSEIEQYYVDISKELLKLIAQ